MKYAILLAVGLLATTASVWAVELGDVTSVDEAKRQIEFYIGDLDVKIGEVLAVLDSTGRADIKIRVVDVKPPQATGEFIAYQYGVVGNVETLHTGRRVQLTVDPNKITSFSFVAGINESPKVGAFGGTQFSVGLSIIGHLSPNWLGSIELQADDLGKDGAGDGQRVSYYMLGVGKAIRGFQILGHLGVADDMTMPAGGTTVIDPFTGAAYPNNVQHTDSFGYLLEVKRPFFIGAPTRDNMWGWGLSPVFTYGGALGHSGFKPTAAIMLSIDLLTAL